MGRRNDIDWETIELDYRAGQLSVRQIAAQRGVSHTQIGAKARERGWSRKLAGKVREAVQERLLREGAAPAESSKESATLNARVSDAAIIDEAAARGVHVVRQHRHSLGRMHNIVAGLAGELETVSAARDKLVVEVAGDDSLDAKAKKAMLKAFDLPSRAQIAAALSVTLKNLIPLERRAFNLDEPGEGDNPNASIGTKVLIVPAKDGTGAPVVKKLNLREDDA